MNELKINLVGDVKSDLKDEESIQSFLIELELLMTRFKIDHVDIGWKKFNK